MLGKPCLPYGFGVHSNAICALKRVQDTHLSTNRKKTEQERKQRIPSPFFLLFSNFRENGVPNADSLNKGEVSLDYKTNI